MSRSLCLALILGSLAAAPGCSSCFGGGNSCRRPSFMEFRSPCSSRAPLAAPLAPMSAPPCGAPACGPACDPCQSAAPCCEEGGVISSPASAPAVHEQGTFS